MTEHGGKDGTQDRWTVQAGKLPRDIQPERDLWPEIEARLSIAEEPRVASGGWRLGGAIAAAVALVAITSTVTVWVVDRQEPAIISQAPAPAGIARPARALPSEATFGPGYALGPKFERARQQLSRDLDEQLESLSPQTREVVKKNLAHIRQAMAEINGSLADDPGNVLLQQLLMAAYQDEMAMLMEVNRMAQSLPTRKEI
ncbi:MAG: hypothetical protein JSW21_10380 [Gammaproteobacteria bacterium]|nr:MAG: hypothetical protein JSW21_10380 [Gammaproteobacteria bacterium]